MSSPLHPSPPHPPPTTTTTTTTTSSGRRVAHPSLQVGAARGCAARQHAAAAGRTELFFVADGKGAAADSDAVPWPGEAGGKGKGGPKQDLQRLVQEVHARACVRAYACVRARACLRACVRARARAR